MKAVLIIACLAGALAVGPAFAEPRKFQSIKKMEQNCRLMWSNADVDRDGRLAGDEAAIYLDAMRASQFEFAANDAGVISDTEFNNACTLGLYATAIRRACAGIWERNDVNADDQLAGAEASAFIGRPGEINAQFDANGDGSITAEEFNAMCELGILDPRAAPRN